MRWALLLLVLFFSSVIFVPISSSESVLDSNPIMTKMTDVHGVKDTRVILQNNSHIQLFELTNNTVLDTKSCQSFHRINALADTVMCSDGIYSIGTNNLTLIHNGPIDIRAQPKTNFTLEFNGNYQSSNPECLKIFSGSNYGSLKIMNGTNVHKSIQLSLSKYLDNYETISIKSAYLHEDSTMISLTYTENTFNYYCAPGSSHRIYTFDYNSTSGIGFVRQGGSNGVSGLSFGSGSTGFSDIRNGVVHVSGNSIVRLYPGTNFPTEEGDAYDLGYMRPSCSITATEVGVSGDYVTLDGVNYPIENTPNAISCNSGGNATMIVNGKLVTLWNDEDLDGYNDLNDAFVTDNSQWSDIDGDGYGDNPGGVNPDSCPSVSGKSYIDMFGCLDIDGDGVSNSGDAFPRDSSQTEDTDQDGYGDNSSGNLSDSCPTVYGTSNKNNTLGCSDVDDDGWADFEDKFSEDSSQWADTDNDGFGDQLNGFQGDECPTDVGNSTVDRYGCLDFDGDGTSDKNDAFPNNPTQTTDRDGDGYGDSQESEATQVDEFPSDTTQWNDTDGDGYGDNPNGNLADRFPNDPGRWQDSDHDGVADQDDAFPDERSQANDSDGDGYGDNPDGVNPDAFPDNPNEWFDTDGDNVGNNEDDFPFDPSQITDSDGDGFGDNPLGNGADKFPNDITQWLDIDGDGYGDNPNGTTPDAFITDPTQWLDSDGDGFGDNPSGRQADIFPNDSTQWEDTDGDGLGDNQDGNNPDPSLFDFDNDGYNDTVDILPKLASPGDLDADGCLDEIDVFPTNPQECFDNDGDGEGDNTDVDDDNDGWADTDEIRLGTDPQNPEDEPVESFEIVIPGTTVGLGAWDLIGIFGGVPLFAWIGFGFVTRNSRCARYENLLKEATTREELEQVAIRWEYSLMLRMLGPHQGIRLERLRAELDDKFEKLKQPLSSIESNIFDQTQLVIGDGKQVPEIKSGSLVPDSSIVASQTDSDGYDWLDYEGEKWYRVANSGAEWTKFDS